MIKRYFYKLGIFLVEVKILERRANFNRTDVLITPMKGEGQKWIYEGKLKVKGSRVK